MPQQQDNAPSIETRYVNNFRVGYNRHEFVLDLGESFEDVETFFWRVVCTPPSAQALCAVLLDSLNQHSDEFSENAAKDGPADGE